MSEPTNSKTHIIIPAILCVGLAAGMLIGARFGGRTSIRQTSSGFQKLQEVLGLVQDEYVDDVKTEGLVDDAIHHLLSKLDPHSMYISARDVQSANEDLNGNYEGIGIEFGIFHDTLVVVSPLSGGPSEAVGLHSGDRIVKVDTTRIAGIKLTNVDVTRYLKGPKGTKVNIEVVRRNEKKPLHFTITRDKIPQYSLEAAYMIDSEVGYIKIRNFARTTHEEFKAALADLKSKGMKKLVLDLQNNPGGLMERAINLADEFLPEGQKIVFTKSKDKKFDQDVMSTSAGDFEQGDLIVLVNEGSASASEIVAGALQDNDRALIIGRRSFGKGLVQSPFELKDGSELRLVISRYYTPSGRSIQKPYGEEVDYSRDMLARYKHGEFFTADSVKFNDSLKYKTTNGRTVYGGGGIMPDYFVPLDTSSNSRYLSALVYSNSLQEYALEFSEANKESLKAKGFEDFKKNFVVSEKMLNDLVAVGKGNKVKPDYKDLAKNHRVFQINIKAVIGRKIWGPSGYYPILNEDNEILQQALKMFDKVPEVSRRRL